MKILIDTNVLLDVALKREPFFADSAAVLDWAEMNPQQAAIAWHSASNIAYLLKGGARDFLAELLSFVEIAAGDTPAVRQALAMPARDFEDALQVTAGLNFGADFVITRNTPDYKRLPIHALTPKEFVAGHLHNKGEV